MKKRVYTLYRVSTKKQVNKSENHENDIPLQRDVCHEFSAMMPDWEIVKEFEEKGVSGFKVSAKDRDAILDLQEAALNNEFDVLLVFMFDRIGRIDDETPFIVEWFVKQCGVEVWSAKEGQQCFESHVDKLTNYIRFWQASGESEKTSIRVKSRMRQLKLQGVYTGGPLQYGYCLIPGTEVNRKGQQMKKYAVDMEQYIVYRKVVEKTINNGAGTYILARMLDEQGYRTNNGGRFTSKTIVRMLTAKMPRGYLEDGETSDELQKLKIISDEEAAQIDEILAQRSKKDEDKRRIARTTKGKALLSGNIFCAHCGGRIITTHHKDHYIRKDGSEYLRDEVKYRCYHKTNKLCECDGQTNYKAARIDEIVTGIMRQMFANMKGAPEEEKLKEIMQKKRKAYRAAVKKASYNIEKNKRQLEILQLEIGKTLLGDSIYTPADLQDAIRVVKNRIAEDEEKIAQMDKQIFHQDDMLQSLMPAYRKFKGWAEEFDSASLEQKKMIACQLFDRVELGKGYTLNIKLNVSYEQFCEGWQDCEKSLECAG